MSGRVPADTLIRGAVVVAPGVPPERVDVRVSDGVVAAVGEELPAEGGVEIDGRGLHLFPGVVDPHVHLNDPGRAHWEGWSTGTAALAAGGATTAVDMPLNAIPPTVDGAAFDAKLRAAEGRAHCDFALWGGLVPGNAEALPELAARGVVGFKAFMCPSGGAEFAACDPDDLHEGMAVAAALGRPVAVHAEDPSRLYPRTKGRAMADWLTSRPVAAETSAIATALELAEATGCSLHVVHVSSGEGVALVAEAAARGVGATCEVTPHHLVLTSEDAERIGVAAKCAPPLRAGAHRDALWAGVVDGRVALVASDHSPAAPEDKAGDAMSAWGGIAGAQSTLELLLTEGAHGRGVALERLASVFAAGAARRFALPGKGALEVGADADLVLADLSDSRRLTAAELRYRHPGGPYVGHTLRARVVRTLLRGETAYGGGVLGQPRGRWVRPSPG